MQIQALQNLPARPAPGVGMPGNSVGGAVARGDAYWRLAMRDGRDLYLASLPGGGVTLQPGNAIGNVLVDWMVVPVRDNLVRLQEEIYRVCYLTQAGSPLDTAGRQKIGRASCRERVS